MLALTPLNWSRRRVTRMGMIVWQHAHYSVTPPFIRNVYQRRAYPHSIPSLSPWQPQQRITANWKNISKSIVFVFEFSSLFHQLIIPLSPIRIHYSDRYTDDEFEYRHVILPKPLLKMIPKQFFSPDDSGTLRLLAEPEWRGIGITQSLGWEHYEVHGAWFIGLDWLHGSLFVHFIAPEPHVLLFRRPKNFVPPQQPRVREGRRKWYAYDSLYLCTWSPFYTHRHTGHALFLLFIPDSFFALLAVTLPYSNLTPLHCFASSALLFWYLSTLPR